MRTFSTVLVGMLLAVVIIVITGVMYVRTTHLETRAPIGQLETRLARMARRAAVPEGIRATPNPVARTPEALADGRSHFADHCASCHANDGSGATALGRGFYPPAPDMRQPATQELSDGELFWVIEHGIRFTGMPAWGTGTKEGEDASWRLVHFIRHLPALTDAEIDEMKTLNPRPPGEVRQELEEERFLSGETP